MRYTRAIKIGGLGFGCGLLAVMPNQSQAASNRPAGYTTICKIDQTCSVSQQTNVAFGAAGKFVYKVLDGSFVCSVDTFGSDPIPSKSVKECSISSDSSSTPPADSDSDGGSVTLSGQAGDGEVSLVWSALSGINGLSVYYDTDSNPSGRVRLDMLSTDTTSYTATDLTNGTPYWFWIKYRTSADDVWHNSEAFSATPKEGSGGDIILVQSLSINVSDVSDGSVQQLSVSVSPSNASMKTVEWRVDNTSIARISSTGLLTPLDDGRVTVTATATDGSDVSDSVVIDIGGIDVEGTVVDTESEILSAIGSASAGSVIYVRGGTYSFDSTIKITKNGTSSQNITLAKYPSDSKRPVFDFSEMSENSSNRGFVLSGDYWHIYGIDVKKAGDNGMFISGSGNTIEFSTFSENSDTGLQLGNGASNNFVKNSDSFYNADSSLENADGFAAKLDVGNGNKFYGCRSYNNLDDGFDGYLRGADNITTTYEHTWAFRNGYLKNGTLGEGDGNGFKSGGSDDKKLKHNAVFINTIAAGNAVDGYDHNSNRGTVTIYNSVAHDNGRNINFSSTNPAKKLIVKNTVSLDSGKEDSLKADSTDVKANSWQDVSTNEGDFGSVDIDDLMAPRKSDGSLPDIEYFHLESDSDLIDAGVDVGLDYKGSAPDIGAFEKK